MECACVRKREMRPLRFIQNGRSFGTFAQLGCWQLILEIVDYVRFFKKFYFLKTFYFLLISLLGMFKRDRKRIKVPIGYLLVKLPVYCLAEFLELSKAYK